MGQDLMVKAEDLHVRLANLEAAVFGGSSTCPALILGSNGVEDAILPAPTENGQIIRVVDMGGYAHTITAPANGINGNRSVVTFSGIPRSYVVLKARAGVWTVIHAQGVGLS